MSDPTISGEVAPPPPPMEIELNHGASSFHHHDRCHRRVVRGAVACGDLDRRAGQNVRQRPARPSPPPATATRSRSTPAAPTTATSAPSPRTGSPCAASAGARKIDAAGKNFGGKGIWVISGNDTTVENIEFSGATVPDKNGAGIRQEGHEPHRAQLLLPRQRERHPERRRRDERRSSSSTASSRNNGFGDGYSHNMYIGHEGRFTLRYSYSHAREGRAPRQVARRRELHPLQPPHRRETGPRATRSICPTAARRTSSATSSSKGHRPTTPRSSTYGVEGTTPENPGHDALRRQQHVRQRPHRPAARSSPWAARSRHRCRHREQHFLRAQARSRRKRARCRSTNFAQGDPAGRSRRTFDYRLAPGSPCINTGSDPGTGAGFALLPSRHYVHPANAADRAIDGIVDIGAYEHGADLDAGVDASTPPDASTGSDASIDVARDVSNEGGAPRDALMPDRSTSDAAGDVGSDTQRNRCRRARRELARCIARGRWAERRSYDDA